MRWMKFSIFTLAIFVAFSTVAQTQTRTNRNRTSRTTTVNRMARATSISNSDISGGLKQALFNGVNNAVDSLGRRNGFLDNVRVRIPMPKSLQPVERTLRAVGQGRRVDDFVETMNHAAEEAVPVAADIFIDAIKQMSFSDARNILFSGQDDAATQFFRKTSENRLRQEFRPIVEDFTERVGVTSQYKRMIDKAGFIGAFVGGDARDLDGYITQKAMDGLFLLVADEERRIRKDPVGRTTDILRKVFGILR